MPDTQNSLAPPYNLEAEEALLGAILIDPAILLVPPFKSDAFYQASNGSIWSAFWNVRDRGLTPDYITLRDELERTGRLTDIGGEARLTELITSTASSQNAISYAALVSEAHDRRKALQLASDIARHAYDEKHELNGQMTAIARELLNLGGGNSRHSATLADAARELYEGLQDPDSRKRIVIPTGIMPLVGARPGKGKSALGAQISDLASERGRQGPGHRTGYRVAVFSLEMNIDEWTSRIAHRRARDDKDKYDKGECTPEEVARLDKETIGMTDRDNVLIIDDSRMTTAGMLAKCAEFEPDLVITDHLRLFADKHDGNEVLRLGAISWAHKILAKEFDCAVIAMTQLNRSGEGQAPQLSHIRGSGEIEENADVIIFLQRIRDFKSHIPKDIARFTFGKYRNGNANQRPEMTFVGAWMGFERIAAEPTGLTAPNGHVPDWVNA